MAEKQETVTDLIAWLRSPTEGENAYLTMWRDEIANRLEAAYKRERGNSAAQREAIDYLCERMADMDATFDPSEVECLRAALAAPPRNCDVGTAEEQDERFHRFCVMQRKGSCAGCPDPVGGRTVANGIRECALVWAQMPYEEGGAK